MRKKLFAWVFLIVSLLLIANLIRDIIWLSRADERIKIASNQLESLRQENFHLRQEKAYRESKEFTEQQIRDKLGMAKSGEYVVLLPNEIKQQIGEVSEVEEVDEDLVNWQKWVQLF